jgi:hypothetical protein
MTDPPRRFPAPRRADKIPGGYVVRDANGPALAYVYSRGKLVSVSYSKDQCRCNSKLACELSR